MRRSGLLYLTRLNRLDEKVEHLICGSAAYEVTIHVGKEKGFAFTDNK